MNVLVGISGSPRSGKDTVADYLVEQHGFHRYALADHLKWLCVEYFGVSREVLWGPKTKESRRLLQELGRLLTDLDTNFFVDKVVEKIKADMERSRDEGLPFRAVISDIRRENELELFDRAGTKFLIPEEILESGVSLKNAFDSIFVVKVDRDISKLLEEEPGLADNINHPVEQLVHTYDKWDYLIPNNGTLDDLYVQVQQMMADVLGEVANDPG